MRKQRLPGHGRLLGQKPPLSRGDLVIRFASVADKARYLPRNLAVDSKRRGCGGFRCESGSVPGTVFRTAQS